MTDVLTPANAADWMLKYGNVVPRPANEIKAGVKIGIYGPGGSGKSTLVGTACDSDYGRPMMYLNARGNPHVLSSRGHDVAVFDIPKFTDVELIRRDVMTDLAKNEFPFKSIAIDTVSDLLSLDLRDRYGASANIDWTQHSASTADMLNLARNFSDIADNYGINVFFVLLETPERRTLRGRDVTRSELALNSALQAQLPGIINWLGRLYIDDDPMYTRCLDFRPIESQQVSKFQVDPNDPRFRDIHMEIYNPHLGHILDTVKGGVAYPADRHKKPQPVAAKR
jgi:hypothetical protein